MKINKKENNLNNFRNNQHSNLVPTTNKKIIGIFKFYEHYGFIDGTDLYVQYSNINTALNKDKVEYIILENTKSTDPLRKYEAKIVNVLERAKTSFVGTIIHKEKEKDFVLLDYFKNNKVVTTPITKLPKGEKVKVKIWDFNLENLKGTIETNIGNQEDKNIEITSILEEYNISKNFPEKIKEIVKDINLDIEKHKSNKKRKDYTKIPLVTIDPPNSKDFDDAIAVIKNKEIYTLYIAISDVWSYLKNHEELTKEAQKRATSIYYLDSVIPMIPEKLSNDFCSLVPKQERCALVLEINIKNDGEILWETTKINPGIINSQRRFTYHEINNFIKEKTSFSTENKEVKQSIIEAINLYRILEKNRRKKGYISIDFPESKITLNKNGEIQKIEAYAREEAQFMVENFMILANECVSKFCEKNKIPNISRVHEAPEKNKIISFIQEAQKLGIEIKISETITQKNIMDEMNNNIKNPHIDIVKLLLAKSMQKAKYSIHNTGHYGLNLKNYLHFTSPIRRYPDVIVHKFLWECIFENKKYTYSEKQTIYKELEEISTHCTNKEIEAAEISKLIENKKIIKLLNKKINNIFKAKVISTSSKFVTIINIEELNIEGLIKNKIDLPLGSKVLVKPIYDSKEFKLIKVL